MEKWNRTLLADEVMMVISVSAAEVLVIVSNNCFYSRY
jgi:hypothetical protein